MLNNAVGVALKQLSSDKTVQPDRTERRGGIFRKFGEHSQNSLNDAVSVAQKRLSTDETVQPVVGERQGNIFRESREDSQNSWVKQNKIVPEKTEEILEEVWCE